MFFLTSGVHMDVTVRSAMDNSLLYDATVKWAIPSEGGVSGTGSTGSDGVAILQVDGAHLPTDVELTASVDGYEVFCDMFRKPVIGLVWLGRWFQFQGNPLGFILRH